MPARIYNSGGLFLKAVTLQPDQRYYSYIISRAAGIGSLIISRDWIFLEVLMNPWRIIQVSIAVVGILCVIVGQVFKQLSFNFIGIAILGLAGVFIGLEGIYKRQMVIGSRYRRYGTETFLGAAGVAQGVQFVFLGLFLIAASLLALFNGGEYVFQYFVRRPGWLLVTLGVFCLSSAVIAFSGSVEQRTGTQFERILDLLAARLLPSLILVIISMALFGVGFLEILAPPVFDQIGGGFLEVLFGGK